mmetsp:Transcript_48979/g.66748  ORF Transcript_48979/g.66748 Transcript_48979/m.66748 type:complete len:293 (-) Transcript_48979:354-1232(-)
MEVIKFVSCLLVMISQSKGSLLGVARVLHTEVVSKPGEIAKLAVPSLLYMIQNNLLYFALSNLDATPYQVCYQLKILTSAVFSVIMLRKSMSRSKWFSLLVLTAGVALTKLSQTDASKAGVHQNSFLGFVAVLTASATSGFAGVYFEKVLKGARVSLWVRNIQMGVTSIVLSLGTAFIRDREFVVTNGFFYGYNGVVVSVILLQALGGLVVAMVVKYADNILKGFAASFSIVTSCIIEMIFFDFTPTMSFFFGALLVNASMVLYSRAPTKKPRASTRGLARGRKSARGSMSV